MHSKRNTVARFSSGRDRIGRCYDFFDYTNGRGPTVFKSPDSFGCVAFRSFESLPFWRPSLHESLSISQKNIGQSRKCIS